MLREAPQRHGGGAFKAGPACYEATPPHQHASLEGTTCSHVIDQQALRWSPLISALLFVSSLQNPAYINHMLWLPQNLCSEMCLGWDSCCHCGQEHAAQNVQVLRKFIAGAGTTEGTFLRKKKKKKFPHGSELSRYTSKTASPTSSFIPISWFFKMGIKDLGLNESFKASLMCIALQEKSSPTTAGCYSAGSFVQFNQSKNQRTRGGEK